MFKTKICEILNIQYPIILGGMLWIGKSDLVAAVSEAGGLGLMGAGGMTIEEIESECAHVTEKTKKPFGVNIPLVRPDSDEMINAAIKKGASVIATSSGSPKKFTQMIQDQGCRVIHVVANVTFAKKSEDAGVDAVAAEGFEAGGHNGHDEITTMALIPQVASAVDIPVIAAGGIADGRGLVAALALGAKGVQMGTRFLATHEAAAHQNYKDAIVKMTDVGTSITGRTTIGPTRAINNQLTEMIINAEKEGAKPEELFEMIGEGRSAMACIEGNCEEGSLYCGQIGGAVKEIKSARQIVDDMISEAKTIVESLNPLISH
ncbi:MAG: enoyl-[acyl-carrier-protein] reductase FabK [Desulfobacteraceae bacterium]|nr:nitronate monooxygenase [Desulfobacteraceae bacterium]MBC2755648.1 enoyl-[acyl-carrier-protein] reductase FabK [Desulfobacteraceae bacterium]